mgnify:CR=1 FL=1
MSAKDQQQPDAAAMDFPFEVPVDAAGGRLDRFLAEQPEILSAHLSRSRLKTLAGWQTRSQALLPLIKADKDPIGSMGNDAALACLSDQPRMLYDYFHQIFAQVTNPPIDSIREEVIMSLECYIGPEANLLSPTAESCHRLLVPHPILTNHQMANLKGINYRGWKARVIDVTYPVEEGTAGLRPALDRICAEARDAIREGYSLIVLSDRRVSAERVPVSSLLATGTVHHHLVRHEERARVGLLVESGEAREVHHFCLLIGFGADAVNPYLALYALRHARLEGKLSDDWDDDRIVHAYRSGVAHGMLKVMAKMGISTLQSYKGAQIFEALGIGKEVIDLCFAGTPSRIGGVGFDVLAEESLLRHHVGFPENPDSITADLPNPGLYSYRRRGEQHASGAAHAGPARLQDPHGRDHERVAAGRRHRDHERYAGVGDGADARDRPAQERGGAAARHHAAISDGSGAAEHGRRRDRLQRERTAHPALRPHARARAQPEHRTRRRPHRAVPARRGGEEHGGALSRAGSGGLVHRKRGNPRGDRRSRTRAAAAAAPRDRTRDTIPG